jgi:hypothetical protein
MTAGATIVRDPHMLSFPGLAPYTLEGWVRKDPPDAGANLLSCRAQDGSGYQTFFFGTGLYHKRTAPPSPDSDEVAAADVGTSMFRHVVIAFDGSEGQLFLDAVPVTPMSTVFDVPLPMHATAFEVAKAGSGMLVFDEMAVYDHALSPERIEAHYQCGKNGACE